MKNNISFGDGLEKEVAELLTAANVKFLHESQVTDQRLDFYFPDFDIYIEVKRFGSQRLAKQIEGFDNVMVIQGKRRSSFC